MSDRNKVQIQDDDYSLTHLLEISQRVSRRGRREAIIDALLKLCESHKGKLNHDDLDHLATMSWVLNKTKRRAESRLMYQSREAILVLIEMTFKGLDFETVDEKKRSVIKDLNFNRFNISHQKFLKRWNRKLYDQIKRKCEYAKVHLKMNTSQIKSLGFESVMELPESYREGIDQMKTIEVSQNGFRRRVESVKESVKGKKNKGKTGKTSSERTRRQRKRSKDDKNGT